MKSRSFLPVVSAIAISLLLTFSCSKDIQPKPDQPCPGCGAPPPTQTVYVDATDWIDNHDDTYSSEFGPQLVKASGGYHTIIEVYYISNGSETAIGSGTPIIGYSGFLTLGGTTLTFHSKVFGQLPFKIVSLKVIVN